ncbi:MAG: T9SS type A sorting domain-containing protein [Bacteroidetes bacterium]|nr:T9SS type A sorting domain-containing protein [Bacteroidota bacterium]
MNIAASISQDTTAKSFTNLIFTDTYFGRFTPNDPRAIENNLHNFKDSLHFNSVHVYGYGNFGGGFDEPIGDYSSYVTGLMNQVNNSGLKGFYGRNKIEKLCCGQRLIYEAEGGNNGFSYSSNAGYLTMDSGRQVVKGCLNTMQCPETDGTPRYLCQNIYENLQHGDLIDFSQWDLYDWHMKPVMRIDSNVVDNNPNAKVIRIDVINYKGVKIDSIIIKARNFAKFNAQSGSYLYPGNYLNTYNFDLDPGVNLEISGDTASGCLSYGMHQDPWENWKNNCKVDFKIWWYGEVDVWFDKMIVDDKWANNLFHADTIISNSMNRRITEEVTEFTDNIGEGSFYIDEVTHSQIPCIMRVYELMKQTNPNAKLNFATSNYHNIRSYKDNTIGNMELFKQINSESFNADAHEIQDVLPNSLNSSLIDPKIDPFWLRPKDVYNEYLQKRFFGDKSRETGIDTIEGHWVEYAPSNWGSLVYQIELARNQRDLYSPNKKFIMQPQIQGVLKIDTTGYYKGGVREPLNEEIEAEAMLSIAHGADGICWFTYYGQPTEFKSGNYYIYGLQNHDSINNFPHRHKNMYGQDKWKAVRDMNIKIEHWKSTLDNINWVEGWSVHKDSASHFYISDIKSIRRNPSFGYTDDPPYAYCDGTNERYWEMGFFNPDDATDKGKYFIMVNRRCVPDLNNQGDFRELKIKFDSTNLVGFRNWKIIELDSNKVIRTFDKDSNVYVNMGEFNPGEGKLYKLSPVMQEGGTLVADESVNGIQFVCKDEVNNNGKNIRLSGGTSIQFKEDAGINMTGGDFICSNSNLSGSDSSQWNGIFLSNTEIDSIMNSTFSDAKTSVVILNDTGYFFINRFIKNNIFNVPAGSGNNGIYGENNFRITIQDNTFNMPDNPADRHIGVYLKNNNTTGVENLPEENEPAPNFRMFLIHNTFNNGTVSAMLMNYTSSYLPFYVKSNTLNSSCACGIVGRNMTGSIKDNIISYTGALIPMGIHLITSSPDLYNNIINTENVSLHTVYSSYPNLAPAVSGSSLSWTGGKNRLTSLNSDNIQIGAAGNAYTDLGENRFTIQDTSENRYHIFGWVDTSLHKYFSMNNCWYLEGNARIYLRRNNTTNPLMTETGVTSIDCSREIDPNGWIADYLGNGVYDSIKQSADTAGSDLTEEEQLYLQGQNYVEASLYQEGISSFKDLIDTYVYFEDLPASVYDLYSCYEYLDTNSEQSYRNTLYGNLKEYLDNKINSEEGYDAEFLSNCYNITLMCEANMLEYDNAANGYEFIALFHPDPDVRLNASWDYAEIEALMGGGYGGGEKQLKITNDKLRIEKFNELKEINEMKRINEIVSNDPIMSRMKVTYETISKERADRIEKSEINISESSKTNLRSNEKEKENLLKSEQYQKQIQKQAESDKSDKFKNEKARRNIFELKNLSKPELEKRRIDDMFLSAKDERNTKSEKDQINRIPLDYKLNQNYPNPFNPVTKINFELPEDAIVNITVYDLLGREVVKLINNDFRKAGVYTVEFTAKNLSSGVYFYRLDAGSFMQTKRMIFLK